MARDAWVLGMQHGEVLGSDWCLLVCPLLSVCRCLFRVSKLARYHRLLESGAGESGEARRPQQRPARPRDGADAAPRAGRPGDIICTTQPGDPGVQAPGSLWSSI